MADAMTYQAASEIVARYRAGEVVLYRDIYAADHVFLSRVHGWLCGPPDDRSIMGALYLHGACSGFVNRMYELCGCLAPDCYRPVRRNTANRLEFAELPLHPAAELEAQKA